MAPPNALLPVLVDLSPSQVVTFERSRAVLEEAGFRIEPMGERTFALTAFPDIFDAEEAKAAFLEILAGLEEETEPDRKAEKMLATLACHSAVKAHQPLPEKMEFLVEAALPDLEPGGLPSRPADPRQDRKGPDRERSEADILKASKF